MEKYKRTFLDKIFKRPSFEEVEDVIESMVGEGIEFAQLADNCHTEMSEGADYIILEAEEVVEKITDLFTHPECWERPVSNVA